MRAVAIAAILAIFFPLASLSQAGEADFLRRFEGSWSGGGSVKLRVNTPARQVACNLKSKTKADELSMGGVCRAMMLVSRRIGAEIKVDGARYSGTYVDPAGKTSLLSGTRSGSTLNLAIRWAKEVNGDRQARMEIASLPNGRMRLRTIDTDPGTGKAVVTSNIELVRRP
jgi:hypothetical protein